ncbi:MAG: domain/SEC-C motif protein [Candidatus Paceibacter sp.]|jgi:predicted O-linked N-acetylglucosamine transferase (SPINDLY family)|nr:domain/SEC-C motif protein [Candidatus Paceibacter sp.]
MNDEKISKALELNTQGIKFADKGLFGQAIACFTEAIELLPTHWELYNNLAKTYNEAGDFQASINTCLYLIQKFPINSGSNFQNIAKSYGEMARHNEALSYYYQALDRNPDSKSVYDDLLLTLNYTFASRQSIFLEHAKFGRFDKPEIKRPHVRTPHNRKINIGYISPDFRDHPVGYLMKPILEYHNRSAFKIFLYNNTKFAVRDEVTNMFQKQADVWRDIEVLEDADVAELIRKDEIDILVDLTGHTGGNRLGVFVERPAPIQVSWLGYMNTTGLRSIDYHITDWFLAPAGTEAFYTEKLWRIQDSFTYLPLYEPPSIKPLPALKNGYVTFGFLNNYKKINDKVLDLWASILKAVPDSKLIFSAKGNEAFHEEIRQRFVIRGIAAERIEMVGLKLLPDFLAFFDRTDIALDPFPFTGLITIYHGLYAGVPSIVLKGASEYERNGSAVMKKVNLPEFIADSEQKYLEKAVYWANHLNELAQIRSTMRKRFNKNEAQEVTRSVEQAFQNMMEKYLE